jgi:hypothetical protein
MSRDIEEPMPLRGRRGPDHIVVVFITSILTILAFLNT